MHLLFNRDLYEVIAVDGPLFFVYSRIIKKDKFKFLFFAKNWEHKKEVNLVLNFKMIVIIIILVRLIN